MFMQNPGMIDDPAELKKWVGKTLEELNRGLYERENAVALSLLAVLSGQSVFLYGPPGTAKSLIARRLSCIFSESEYFEYLMQRFSTPEEVFGPVSLSELKNDNFVRKTQHYLPSADIAFLDEIWKSSPAILNTLLTIINERKFRNGTEIVNVPLKAIICASNEFPAASSGLDALYDRFILRLPVYPMERTESFESMITSDIQEDGCEISDRMSGEVWSRLIERYHSVTVSPKAMSVIHSIRESLRDLSGTESRVRTYVSDRRWLKSVTVLKAAAYLSGRNSIEPVDTLILKYTLWSSNEDRPIISRIVEEALAGNLSDISGDLKKWSGEFGSLKKEVKELFENAPKAPREPVLINGLGCYATTAVLTAGGSPEEIYVPFGPKRLGGLYQAWNRERIPVQFQVQELDDNTATIRFTESKSVIKVPVMLGNLDAIPQSTIDTYRRSLSNMRESLSSLRERCRAEIMQMSGSGESLFVDASEWKKVSSVLEEQEGALEGYGPQITALEKLIDDYTS